MNKMQMLAEFKIKNHTDIKHISVGGFCFNIDGQSVPFDFDASGAIIKDGVVKYESGYGAFFNDFEISDVYNSEYEDLGLDIDDISAEFLASADEIDEFYVHCEDSHGNVLNIDDGDIEIIYVEFYDRDSFNTYLLQSSVCNSLTEC